MTKKSSGLGKAAMTPKAAARIHSAEARKGGGVVPANSFTARAQRTVAQKPSGK